LKPKIFPKRSVQRRPTDIATATSPVDSSKQTHIAFSGMLRLYSHYSVQIAGLFSFSFAMSSFMLPRVS
jgi:hypothetical protein